MKIDFKKITIQNFLSFGNKPEVFEFERGNVINIKGQNLDVGIGKDNSSGNGVGKTTVFQAVTYAIFGKGVNDIKQDEFINLTNGKGMVVDFEFEIDGKPCRIVRKRKPNAVEFYYDGEDYTRDSVANTSTLIEETIGVNYETFVVSFLMTTATAPVLSRKPADQRNFFEDLLNMDKLTERAETIKKNKKDLEVEVKLVNRDLEHAEDTNSQAEARYEKVKENFYDFESNREQQIEKYQDELETLNELIEIKDDVYAIFDDFHRKGNELQEILEEVNTITTEEKNPLEKKINELERDIQDRTASYEHLENSKEELERELQENEANLKSTKDELDSESHQNYYEQIERLSELFEKKSEIEEHIEKLEDKIEPKEKEHKKISDELEHLEEDQCPTCHQKWQTEDKKKYVEGEKEKAKDLQAEIAEFNASITQHKENLSEVDKEIDKKFIDDAAIERFLEHDEQLRKTVEQTQNQIEQDKSKLETTNKRLTEAQEKADPKVVERLKKDLETAQTELEEVTKRLNEEKQRQNKAKEEKNELQEYVDEVGMSYEEFTRKVSSIDSIKSAIEKEQQAKNPFKSDFEKGVEYVDTDALTEQKNQYEEKIRHQQYLVKLLTDSKSFIRKNIISRYVPYLNKRINTYADSLDSPHFCEIQPDLTVQIQYMRKDVSYHSLSAGERLRLDVSVSLALRDLMATLGVSSNVLMVDELFDSSLDSNGKNNIFKLIKERFDTILLVSHSGEFDDKCDKKLTVTKENGFSRLSLD